MTSEPGLYILDEPESALSIDSCLALPTIMSDMRAAGSQILLATHSPILAAVPDATIYELDEQGHAQRQLRRHSPCPVVARVPRRA